MSKRKLVAVALFIFMSLFIFTFANPGDDGLRQVDDNNNNDNENNDNDNGQNNGDQLGQTDGDNQIPVVDGDDQNENNEQVIVVGDMTVTYTVDGTNLINNLGWANKDLTIAYQVVENSTLTVENVRWCLTNEIECTPTNITADNKVVITEETTTAKICVQTTYTNGTQSAVVCSANYLIDKTAPTLTGVEAKTIELNDNFDPMDGINTADLLSGINGTVIVEGTVDTTTAGTYTLTYKLLDNAGNLTELTREVTVEADAPTIEFTYKKKIFNAAMWSDNKNTNITVNLTDNGNSGIKEALYCMNTTNSEECTPDQELTSLKEVITFTKQSATNMLCVTVTDNAGKTTSECFGPFGIDRKNPTINGADDTTIQIGTTFDPMAGVSATDDLSGIKTVISVEGTVDTTTAGTYTLTYTVKDNAGNKKNVTRIITVDAPAPTIEFNDKNGVIANGWSTTIPTLVDIIVTDNSNTGMAEMLYCKANNGNRENEVPTCTPNTTFNQNPREVSFNAEVHTQTVCVQVTDNNGKTTSACSNATMPFGIDATAPAITGIIDGELTNQNVAITLTEINLESFTITRNGIEVSRDIDFDKKVNEFNNSGDGLYVITATDKAGNTTTLSFTIDKTAPEIINSENNGIIDEYNNKQINLFITDNDLDRVVYTLNGGEEKVATRLTPTSDKFQFGDVTRGEGHYVVTAYDKAGNSTTVEFTVDKTAPVINGVVDGGMYNTTPTITIDEVNLDTVVVTKNGNPYTKGLDSIQYDGVYIITATDKAGHSTTVKFTIDKTAPEIINSENNGIINEYNKSQINLLITDKYLDRVVYTLNGGEEKVATRLTPTSDKFQFGDVTRGEGHYVVTAYDKAGNSTTVEFTVDKTAPVINGVVDGGMYNTTPTITIDEVNLDTVVVTKNGNPYTKGLDSIQYDGVYIITATDKAGNYTTVKFTIDKTAPEIINSENNGVINEYNKSQINLLITDKYLDRVEYTVNGGPVQAGKPINAGSDKYQFGDVTRGEGHYVVTAYDKAGNFTTVTFTVDRTNPTITGINNGETTNQNVMITITEANIASFEITRNGGVVTRDIDLTKEVNSFNNSADGLYVIKVVDKAGRTAELSFTIDKTGPVINGVANNGIYNTVPTITVTETNLDTVVITKDGQPFTGDLADIKEDGTYVITATDKAGNTATVTFILDQTNPVITDNETDPTNVEVAMTSTVQVMDNITALDATSGINTFIPTGNNVYLENGVYYLVTTTPGPTEVTYTATDNAGNVSTATRTYNVMAPTPTLTLSANPSLNFYGWAKEDIAVTINTTETNYTVKSCLTDQATCTPTTDNGLLITNETRTSKMCVTITSQYNVESAVVCTNAYQLDKTPPIQGTLVLNGRLSSTGWYTSNVDISVRGTIDSLSGYGGITTNHGKNIVTTDGDNIMVRAYITDVAGNSSYLTQYIKRDTVAPVINGVDNNGLYNTVPSITITEAYLDTTVINKDGQFFSNDLADIQADGVYTITATDKAGHSKTVTFEIDQTGPEIINEKNNGIIPDYTNANINLLIAASDLDRVVYTLNGGEEKIRNPLTPTSIKYQFGNTTPGDGLYVVTAYDKLGNSTTVSFTVDKTLPTITGVAEGTITDQDINISVTEKNLKSVVVTKDGQVVTQNIDLTKEVNTFVVTESGLYVIQVEDKAGNKAELSFTIDKDLNKAVSLDATHSDPNTYSRGTTDFDYNNILVEYTTKANNKEVAATGTYSVTPLEGTFNKVLTLRETKTATVTYEGLTDTFEYVLVRTHAEALIEYAKDKYSHLDEATRNKIENLYGTIGNILTKYEDDLLNAYNSNENVKNTIDQLVIDIVKQLEMIADDKELQTAIKEDITSIFNDIKTIISETNQYLEGLDAETKALLEAATNKINESIDTLTKVFNSFYDELNKLETEIKNFVAEAEKDIDDIIEEFENKISTFNGSVEELIKLIEDFSKEIKDVIIPNIKNEATEYFEDLTSLYATEMENSLNNYITDLENTINTKLQNIMSESIKDLLAIVFGIDNLSVEDAKIYADALMALQNTDFEQLLSNLNSANAALNEYNKNAPTMPTGQPEAPVEPALDTATAIANALKTIDKATLQGFVAEQTFFGKKILDDSRVNYDKLLELIHNGNFSNFDSIYNFDGLSLVQKGTHAAALVDVSADIVNLINAKTTEATNSANGDYATAKANYDIAKKEYDEVLLPAWQEKMDAYLAAKALYDQESAKLQENVDAANSALITEAKALVENVTAIVNIAGLDQHVITSATQMLVSLVTGDTTSALNHFKDVMLALTNNSNTIAFVMDAYTPISNLVSLGANGIDETDLETLVTTAREIIALAEKHNIDQEINKALNAIVENITDEFNVNFVRNELNNLKLAITNGIKNATNKLGTENYPLLPSDKLTEMKNNILSDINVLGTTVKVNQLVDNLMSNLLNGKIINIIAN